MKFEKPPVQIKSKDTEENEIAAEDRFYELIEELGKELGEKWEGKLQPALDNGTLSFQDACQKLNDVIKNRKNVLENMQANVQTHHSPEMIQHLKECVERILRSKRTDNFLGNGAVAEVYTIDETDYCCKFILNQERYKEGNNVYQEVDFLERLNEFVLDEVRTPTYIKCFSGGDLVAIVMERLDAVDLQRVIEGLDKLPDTFDIDDYFQRVESYLNALHQKGIFHQDLYTRNLMADRRTGHPRVIDFGKAVYSPFTNESSDFEKKDWAQFQASKYKLKQFLAGEKPE